MAGGLGAVPQAAIVPKNHIVVFRKGPGSGGLGPLCFPGKERANDCHRRNGLLDAAAMNEWYYAKGGQQQGPVSREQLLELIRDGGLDAEKDLVWNSSMSDWKPASQVTGLVPGSAVTTADPNNPYAAPTTGWNEPDLPVTGDGALTEIAPGSEPIDPMACLKRGFDLTKRHFGSILVVGLAYLGISIVATLLFGAVDNALGFGAAPQNPTIQNQFATQQQSGPVEAILGQILSIFLSLGVTRIGLNIVSGKDFSVGMLFGEGRKLIKAIAASILFGLMIVIGFICLIVPGIYLALRFGQYMFAIVDKDLGVIESFKYSSEITKNNKGKIVMMGLLAFGVIIAGLLALVVGLVFAVPVTWIMGVVAFRWMQYGHRAAMDHPGTTKPMLAGV